MGSKPEMESRPLDIAVVGMAGRFPGAPSVDDLWSVVRHKRECVTFFSAEEYLAAGGSEASLSHPRLVRAEALIEDAAAFDAGFFGYSPREAEMIDPQHRLCLETAYACFENAGYDPLTYPGVAGVYIGSGLNRYLIQNLYPNLEEIARTFGAEQAALGNGASALPNRISYELNLRGPSVFVQTACSTSLVAIHLACQDLIGNRCDVALGGGVSVNRDPRQGYWHAEGALSPDGHCRPFDAKAQGIVPGSGLGLVLLKRLDDAVADGDTVHAVILGGAVNSDGSRKAGFSAPSVQGQSEVIVMAQTLAGVEPESISYVETHGTATPMGDPIEFAALTQAFRRGSPKRGFCALSSLKSNIGHLDAAAGAAGFIKAVLALKHKQIPPSVNFDEPNPQIDFASSPFYVATRLLDWPRGATPRRAAVSSFGAGGTNAHVILEEAPEAAASPAGSPAHILPVSAKTGTAMRNQLSNLARAFRERPDLELADAAFTLQRGRGEFPFRHAVVAESVSEAARKLEQAAQEAVPRRAVKRRLVFLFPGGGTQYVNMGRGLYELDTAFRQAMDACFQEAAGPVGFDLRQVLFPNAGDEAAAETELRRPPVLCAAVFSVEYALAKLWISRGVEPGAMIGHSLGEYAAACVAGVMTLQDALRLVALRGRLFEETPAGATVTVVLPEAELQPFLGSDLSLAAINGPGACVVSGPLESIERLERDLTAGQIYCRRAAGNGAAHSQLIDPVLPKFAAALEGVRLREPGIPYVSNVTGRWILPAEAQSPEYWIRHMRRTVRFGDGLRMLGDESASVFLEVGPGRMLTSLAAKLPGAHGKHLAIPSMRPEQYRKSDGAVLLEAQARMWAAGQPIAWDGMYRGERRRRIPLPSYPYERERYWIEPPRARAANNGSGYGGAAPGKPELFAPLWKQTVCPPPCSGAAGAAEGAYILIGDAGGWRPILEQKLVAAGRRTIAARDALEAAAMLRDLAGVAQLTIVWEWSSGRNPDEIGRLAQAAAKASLSARLSLWVCASGSLQLPGEGDMDSSPAFLPGLLDRIRRDFELKRAGLIDAQPFCADRVLAEIMNPVRGERGPDRIAYRGPVRWTPVLEPVAETGTAPIREDGAYLIAGDDAGRAVEIACHAASIRKSRFVLALPPARGRSAIKTGPERWGIPELEEQVRRRVSAKVLPASLKESLDRLCALYVLDFLRQAGVSISPGATVRIDSTVAQAGVAPQYRNFFELFLLRVLEQDRLIRRAGDSITFLTGDSPGGSRELKAGIEKNYPEYRADLDLLEAVTSRYGEVLSGRKAMLEVLDRQTVLATLGGRIDHTHAGVYVAVLAELLARLASSSGKGKLRILEAGAGEGILTWPVMEKLRGSTNVEYVFTDIGRSFAVAAERRAASEGYRNMRFGAFDISRDAKEQGYQAHSFDLVLAFNVVHVPRDLRGALANLRELLAPGGALLLLEGTKIHRPVMMIFGLQEEFWRVADDSLRDGGPFLSAADWSALLEQQGFVEVRSYPQANPESDYSIVIGREAGCLEGADLSKLENLAAAVAVVHPEENGPLIHRAVIEDATSRFGRLDGVICAMSSPGSDEGAAWNHTQEALRTASQALEGQALDFALVVHPRSATTPAEAGTARACAAFAAASHSNGGQRWTSLAWDGTGVGGDAGAVECFRQALARPDLANLVSDGRAATARGASAAKPVSDPTAASATTTFHQRPPLETPYVAPRNPAEEAIARIWSEVLGIERIGIDDNFFDLGGESLMATQLAGRLRQHFGRELALRDLFAEPTVSGVAKQIGREAAVQLDEPEIVPVSRADRRAVRSQGVISVRASN